MQQPSLALQKIAESLPPPRHKRSTDEVFSEPQRLHKVLASCGFGSRRAMEEMILAGRITVNRMPAEVGQKVGPGDEVRINGELVKVRFAEPRARILMYHKPAGELVTRDDPEGRPTVFGKLPSIGNGKWINIGRLDYNTEGLLLFTNSGELANRMMHPRFEVEREYAVRVMGRLSDEQIERLTTGIELEDGPAKCERVEDGGGDDDGANHWYKVVLREGRNREVRRLFEALGLMVSRLIRTRYGAVAMPTVLKRGDVVELEAGEVANVLNAAGLRGANGKNGAPHDPRQGNRKGPHPQGGRGRPGQHHRPGHPQGGAPRGPMQGQGGGHGKPHGRPGGKPAFQKGPRPNGPTSNHVHDYDERQPLSNANASPFGRTTLTVPGGTPHGRPGGERPPFGQGGRRQGQGDRRFGQGNRGPGGGPRPPGHGNRPQGQAAQGPGPGPGTGQPRPHGRGNPNKRHRRGGNRPRAAEANTANATEGLPRDDVVRVDDES
jgi:23S rRNA pseudouridine2605 synthase